MAYDYNREGFQEFRVVEVPHGFYAVHYCVGHVCEEGSTWAGVHRMHHADVREEAEEVIDDWRCECVDPSDLRAGLLLTTSEGDRVLLVHVDRELDGTDDDPYVAYDLEAFDDVWREGGAMSWSDLRRGFGGTWSTARTGEE